MFDLDLLTSTDPFEIDTQAAHLFKHPNRGIDDIREVWASDPLFSGAGRSAAIQPPKNLPTNTGEIDDRSDDPR
jgi:hypothetical protein